MLDLRGLIVSCQAPPGSPLRDPQVIAALAEAAVIAGAAAVRIESPEHVRAVRARLAAPVVGLWKRDYASSPVYITPTFEDARAIAEAGADLIAIDATDRPRPGDPLPTLIARIHAELNRPVLADVATLVDGIAAARAGADAVASTLCGYTDATRGTPLPALDLVAALVAADLKIPVWCEGGVSSPADYAAALARGAQAVVVGTALTGLEPRVRTFIAAGMFT